MASGKRSIEIESVGRGLTTSSHSAFQGEEGLRLICYPAQQLQVANSSPKTRQLSGFIDAKMFSPDRERFIQDVKSENSPVLRVDAIVQRDPVERPIWRQNGGLAEGNDYDDEDDVGVDDDEESLEDERLDVGEGCSKINTDKFKSSCDRFGLAQIDKRGLKQHGTLGVSSNTNHQQGKDYWFQNVLPISSISGDGHCVRAVNVSEALAAQGMPVMENGSISVSTLWKEAALYESVRSILSDPITGELMDDAVIFPCGHSFGSGGCQHSLQKTLLPQPTDAKFCHLNHFQKACCTCLLPITENSVQRNLTLRAAVAAFRREENDNHSLKRRKYRLEEKADINDSNHMDSPRSRKLQFQYAVADRVMIVGNKRTPQRFVGREALIMSKCVNGWYVVKMLDNSESVKMQYRSLAKVPCSQSNQ